MSTLYLLFCGCFTMFFLHELHMDDVRKCAFELGLHDWIDRIHHKYSSFLHSKNFAKNTVFNCERSSPFAVAQFHICVEDRLELGCRDAIPLCFLINTGY